VLTRTDFWTHPNDYFQDARGYIVGDSAYRLTNFLIKPFALSLLRAKEPGDDNPQNTICLRRNFNKYLSSAQVNVEHTIGLLKLRFPILRHIGMVIGMHEQNTKVVKLQRAAWCLHNFLLDHNDHWELMQRSMLLCTGKWRMLIADLRTLNGGACMTMNRRYGWQMNMRISKMLES
jgi:hypothetical protein